MVKREHRRLEEIERDLLDDSKPLATALLKAVTLGGELKSVPLREWASKELRGYEDGPELPDYRRVGAPLLIDGATPGGIIKRQRWAPSLLPDFAKEHIGETVELRSGVGTLEDHVRRAEARGEDIKISPFMSADIVRFMNQEVGPGEQIIDLYWGVTSSTVRGVLDRIRTAAVEIMSELRSGMPDDDTPPSPEVADQAVQVVLHGGKRNRVNVNTAQADRGGTARIVPADDQPESWWTKTGVVWTVLGVLVALIAAYFTYRQWRG